MGPSLSSPPPPPKRDGSHVGAQSAASELWLHLFPLTWPHRSSTSYFWAPAGSFVCFSPTHWILSVGCFCHPFFLLLFLLLLFKKKLLSPSHVYNSSHSIMHFHIYIFINCPKPLQRASSTFDRRKFLVQTGTLAPPPNPPPPPLFLLLFFCCSFISCQYGCRVVS